MRRSRGARLRRTVSRGPDSPGEVIRRRPNQKTMGNADRNVFPVRVFPFLCQTQQIVGADTIIFAQRDQMVNGQFICTPLIAGVHGLRGSQDLSDLCLRLIGILPQIPEDPYIVHIRRLSFPLIQFGFRI